MVTGSPAFAGIGARALRGAAHLDISITAPLAQPRRIAFAFLGQVDHEFGERCRGRVFAVADTELAQRAFESLCEEWARKGPER
jgi:hypothetical protein